MCVLPRPQGFQVSNKPTTSQQQASNMPANNKKATSQRQASNKPATSQQRLPVGTPEKCRKSCRCWLRLGTILAPIFVDFGSGFRSLLGHRNHAGNVSEIVSGSGREKGWFLDPKMNKFRHHFWSLSGVQFLKPKRW